jgi:2-succinyl-5-enolpyruvyl-6-hydroxy-3-cyclohexene-1-carboxylate synthase
VRWYAEAPPPQPGEASLRYARALACRAVAATRGRPAGPVQLNLPFREPLEPAVVPGDALGSAPLATDGRGDRPYTGTVPSSPALDPQRVDELAAALGGCERGAVVCGPLDAAPAEAAAIARLAAALGWPLLAEPTSQLRRGAHVAVSAGAATAHSAALVAGADLFLRDADSAARLAPEAVLRFGDSPTSRPLRSWIERHRPRELVLVDPDAAWHDPGHLASRVVRAEPGPLCEALCARLPLPSGLPSAWRTAFEEAERRTQATLAAALAADPALLAARAVRELAAALPPGATLYVSNSLAVRDLDAFLPPAAEPLRVLCNRGVNGIDGMISSALGAAAAGEGPLALLTGDLAFLHDAGGLLAGRRHGLRASIVVLDDDGGGIFSLLPVAAYGDAVGFEEHFRTPHGLDLGAVSRAYGAAFSRVSSAAELRGALEKSWAHPGVSVIAVPLDRDRNIAQHRALYAAVEQAVRGVAP